MNRFDSHRDINKNRREIPHGAAVGEHLNFYLDRCEIPLVGGSPEPKPKRLQSRLEDRKAFEMQPGSQAE